MSLIRRLATQREVRKDPTISRYVSAESISYVYEDARWVPSWESQHPPESKKADLETGEDQKGE